MAQVSKKTKFRLYVETVDFEDLSKLSDYLTSRENLTHGQQIKEFETKWSAWIGRKYSVFCNSGSSANLLMFYTMLISGRLKNKKVIVPSAGSPTCIAPAIQLGFEPIICDADPETFGLDLKHLDLLLMKHNPHLVMNPYLFGVPHKMEELMNLKKKYEFILLEDVCESIGSQFDYKKLGTYGEMSSFSYHFGQQMNTFEGGMVCTDDPVLYNFLIMLRSSGSSNVLDPEIHHALVQHYEIDNLDLPEIFFEPPFNLGATDLNAYIGLSQMEKIEWEISRRTENYYTYKKTFSQLCEIQTCPDPDATVSNLHFAVVFKNTLQRRAAEQALFEKDIESKVFCSGNLTRHPFWINRYGSAELPNADKLFANGLLLPNHPLLNKDDIQKICTIIANSLPK